MIKVCGNGITTDQSKSVVFWDSHDIYHTWCRNRNMPVDIQEKEWEFLLKKYPISDVLYFPHPIEEAWKNNHEEVWKTEKIREINLRLRNNREIIFHAYMWSYGSVKEMLPFIKYQGFTAIQYTPCQGVKGKGEGWEYYQPLDMAIIDSPIGTKEDLRLANEKANEIGIKTIMDIVTRHVASDDYGNPIPHEKVNSRLYKFIKNVPDCDNYQDRWKYTHCRTGAMPLLDFDNLEYQQICIDFLNSLKEVGIKGFRLDQMKHYPVTSEGSTFLKNVFTPFKDMILYGEVIDCPKWINDMYVNN